MAESKDALDDAMLTLPPLWQEIWRAAADASPITTMQSAFNDGAHFILNRPKAAIDEIIRLKEIHEKVDGWTDKAAFSEFNRQYTEAHRAACTALSELFGERAVSLLFMGVDG